MIVDFLSCLMIIITHPGRFDKTEQKKQSKQMFNNLRKSSSVLRRLNQIHSTSSTNEFSWKWFNFFFEISLFWLLKMVNYWRLNKKTRTTTNKTRILNSDWQQITALSKHILPKKRNSKWTITLRPLRSQYNQSVFTALRMH